MAKRYKKRQKKDINSIGVILAITLFIAVCIIGTYWLMNNTPKTEQTTNTENTESTKTAKAETTEQEEQQPEPKKEEVPTIKVGETWEVEGQWKLTIHSVKRTKYRDKYATDKPADAVYITYSYENIRL